MRKKLYNDGYNKIEFKPNTKKVVIGINIASYHKARYRSFTVNTADEAFKKGVEYINQHNKV